MKKTFVSILLIVICYFSYGQTLYPIPQNLGGPTTLVKTPNYGGFQSGLIPYTFSDTSSANSSLTYLKWYCGAIIYTTDVSALWLRSCYNGSYQWVQIMPSGSPSGSFPWKVGGNNIFPGSSGNQIFGITSSVSSNYGIDFRTRNLTRFILDSTGILPSAGTVEAIGIDNITKKLSFVTPASSVNIYNSDGTITDPLRTVDGDGNQLDFNDFIDFNIRTTGGFGLVANDGIFGNFSMSHNSGGIGTDLTNSVSGDLSQILFGAGTVKMSADNNSVDVQQDSVVVTAENLRIDLASKGANKLLQSDANGNATWVAPSTIAANNIYNADGTLTGNRTLNGNGENYSLTFTDLDYFLVSSTANNRLLINTTTSAILSPAATRNLELTDTETKLTGLANLTTQNRLIGQDGMTNNIGYITLGSGVSLAAGVLSATGSGGTVTGTGTLNFVPKWTPSGSALGNSAASDNGTVFNIGRTFSVTDAASTGVSDNMVFGTAANYTNFSIGRSSTRYLSAIWDNVLSAGAFSTYNNSFPFYFYGSSNIFSPQAGAGTIDFQTNNTLKWQITNAGNFSGSGQISTSKAGAASTSAVSLTGTVFTGGTGTTTFPHFYLNGGAAVTDFNTAGTYIGVNAQSGFLGDYLRLGTNGGTADLVINKGSTTSLTATGFGSFGSVTVGRFNVTAASGFVQSPIFMGGTTNTSSSTYKTTSAAGTTGADHIFQVGNNGATEAMRILNNGNVGIGTAAPTSSLEFGSNKYITYNSTNASFKGYVGTFGAIDVLSIGTSSTFPITFRPGNIEVMRILDGGNVGIGTTSPDSALTVNLGTNLKRGVRFSNNGAGAWTLDANGVGSSTSDIRLKRLIKTNTDGLDEVMKINPIWYHWKPESGLDTKNVYSGFSAQNVKENISYGTGITKDGYLTLQDRAILAAAINAIKELKELNDKQQKEINELKKQIKKR